MRAGLMRSVITIEQPTEDTDAFNTPHITWLPIYSDIRARKWQVKGSEERQRSGEFSKKIHYFQLWYLPGINNVCRIIEAGIIFDIQDVQDVGNRQKELIIEGVELGRRGHRGL